MGDDLVGVSAAVHFSMLLPDTERKNDTLCVCVSVAALAGLD